jgi:hypothetical protein
MQIGDKTSVDRRIAGAFKAASDATGTSFGYLLSTSGRESDHRPDLGSTTSTAKGLFQFVDQTWLDLVKRQGASVGLERYADAIGVDAQGNATVADRTMRNRILALRSDPLVSSVMAAKFTQENATKLTDTLGRRPTEGELYAAHVLGAAGAAKLIRLAQNEPGTTAAVAFPRAAAANPALFYDRQGTAKTVSDLFLRLSGPSDATTSESARSIASAGAALSSGRTDPATLARLVAAQAAAVVAREPIGASEAAADPTGTLLKTGNLIGGLTLPGAQSTQTVGAGRLDGWRAKASSDAFALLLRSDPAETAADPESAGTTAAAVSALSEPAAADARVPGATLVAVAEARTRARANAAPGGIPYVDTSAPLRLGPTDPPAAATTVAAPAVEVAYRPSRLMNRAASGAPEMPLPMVDAARGAAAPARALFSVDPETRGTIATDAVRVATATISVNGAAVSPAAAVGTSPAPASAAVTPLPPTVATVTTVPVTATAAATATAPAAASAPTTAAAPAATVTGDRGTTTAPTTTASTTTAPRRGRRPLDLFAAGRTRSEDRR